MATDVLLLVRPQALRGVASTEGRMTFEELVRGYEDEVYGLALRILGDRDAALEAANLAFQKAYRAFDRYDPSRPARSRRPAGSSARAAEPRPRGTPQRRIA